VVSSQCVSFSYMPHETNNAAVARCMSRASTRVRNRPIRRSLAAKTTAGVARRFIDV
jgi:hypothetical protein